MLKKLQCSVNVTLTCTGKPKVTWLALLWWPGTEPALSPRYTCTDHVHSDKGEANGVKAGEEDTEHDVLFL